MKASISSEYEEEEIYDEEDDMDSEASESSGEHDDDGERGGATNSSRVQRIAEEVVPRRKPIPFSGLRRYVGNPVIRLASANSGLGSLPACTRYGVS